MSDLERAKVLTAFHEMPDWAFIDTRTTALILGCSVVKLRKDRVYETTYPIVPSHKIGGKVMYQKKDILEWLNNEINKDC